MPDDSEYRLTGDGIDAARSRIAATVKVTPVLTSQTLDEHVSRVAGRPLKLYFKCENMQKTGSFKCRGTANEVATLLSGPEKDSIKGFLTYSTGNHGLALAYVAQTFGTPCAVVLPKSTPQSKVDAMKVYGPELIFIDGTIMEAKEMAPRMAQERQYRFVDPHNDWEVMEGQGTLGGEWLEQVPQLDAVLLSAGGGGLISGVAQWFADKHPRTKVFSVEPAGKEIAASVKAGRMLWNDPTALDTIADAVRVRPLGTNCFQVIRRHCHPNVFSVHNEDIREAWRLIHERLKVVVEPAAAMPLAAVLQQPQLLDGSTHIGLLLCGGNVDFVAPPT